MARPNYGPADHCQFNDYPKKIRLVVGQKLASESDLFKQGQPLVLRQTSNSGVLQGEKVVGEELPKKAMIYTDTGDDESFNLKVEYYGWGEFYLANADDDYFSLDTTKGQSVQAGDWDNEKVFEVKYTGMTRIPNTEDMQQELGVQIASTETDLEVADLNEDDEVGYGSTTTARSGSGDSSHDSDDNTIKDTGQPHCVDVYQDVDGDGEKEMVGQYCYKD